MGVGGLCLFCVCSVKENELIDFIERLTRGTKEGTM